MALVGLDLNCRRVRAVSGVLGDYPVPCQLSEGADLPVVISLEHAKPEVGVAGERLRRRLPHLACHGFLPHLGETRRWKAGRHNLDSGQALELLWRHAGKQLGSNEGLVLSLPPYLTTGQADQVRALATKAGVKALGSLPSSLAAALTAYVDDQWDGSVLVVDVDDHALTFALIEAVDEQAHLCETLVLPHLGWHAWRERLIDALADCCILQSRRDPRDSGAAEQGLYEQLEHLLDAFEQKRMLQLAIQGKTWFQNVVITPEETEAFCRPLLAAALKEARGMVDALNFEHLPRVALLTSDAQRLPGLAASLEHLMDPFRERQAAVNGHSQHSSEDDFGLHLLRDSGEEGWTVIGLGQHACARGAHVLVGYFQRGDLPPSHLEISTPLPLPWAADSGPARLTWQGRDFVLDGSTFLVGSQPDCHLRFNVGEYPQVAPRHCEIYYDHRTFVLFNRSRDGAWVNDAPIHGSSVLHPGDRIRLGPAGPVLRFFGQPKARA